MGNPHAVIIWDIDEPIFATSHTEFISTVGEFVENYSKFIVGSKVNVNFVQIENEKVIKVRTFERGSGETMACGTGCCGGTSPLGVARHLATPALGDPGTWRHFSPNC